MHDAVRLQPIALLRLDDRRLQGGVEGRAARRRDAGVLHREPGAKGVDARIDHAQLQGRAVGDRLPSARGRDLAIDDQDAAKGVIARIGRREAVQPGGQPIGGRGGDEIQRRVVGGRPQAPFVKEAAGRQTSRMDGLGIAKGDGDQFILALSAKLGSCGAEQPVQVGRAELTRLEPVGVCERQGALEQGDLARTEVDLGRDGGDARRGGRGATHRRRLIGGLSPDPVCQDGAEGQACREPANPGSGSPGRALVFKPKDQPRCRCNHAQPSLSDRRRALK